METPVELIVAAFEGEGRAGEVVQALRALEREGVVGVINAAVVVKTADGQARFHETGDLRGPQGALFGALTGALVGLLGGPPGVIVGAVAGAATGGLAARQLDFGFDDNLLRDVQASLKPGSSAVIALIRHDWVDQITAELERFEAKLFRIAMREELLAQLRDSGETDGSPANE